MMVSKSSATRTIRLQNDLWSGLSAEAARRGVAVNGLVADLLEVGLLRSAEREATVALKVQRIPPGPKFWPSGALIEPHHTEDPAPKLTLGSSVTFGPQPPKYGARLKTGKAKQ
jgi:hypothetical protein